ncbi:class I SAM-dependent methyltransferase [Lagierella sp.]|uniref:tRNA (mnm(5)s(2)U34)-methyltransferase n=1 Tax=Lagierella sp. TaxID=2849657 RepID=UPI00260FED1E|nr:class I SAM-dependent methyltransferase [Lagierella sp.]
MFKNCIGLLDSLLLDFKGRKVVFCDLTLGNGNDLKRAFDICDSKSTFYGFDIQPLSLKNTRKLFNDKELKNIHLILDSHENIKEHVQEKVDLAIYNLGYLPGGNKNIVTNYNTVIASLENLLTSLNIGGKIFITFYPGHDSGREESKYIQEFLRSLNQKQYEILKFDFINQVNNPPFLITLEKIK